MTDQEPSIRIKGRKNRTAGRNYFERPHITVLNGPESHPLPDNPNLIQCPECERPGVSLSAKTCPGCGFGVRAYFDRVEAAEQQMAWERAERYRRYGTLTWIVAFIAALQPVYFQMDGLVCFVAFVAVLVTLNYLPVKSARFRESIKSGSGLFSLLL